VHLLADPRVERVVALGRRKLEMSHPKLACSVVDLQDQAAIAAALPDGLDIALCSLGTTRRAAGSKTAFRAVDHDAVLAFARAAVAKGARRFVLVSSAGASVRASNFYLRVKGEVEADLAALGNLQVVVLRPSILDHHGSRTESRWGEALGLAVSRPLFRWLAPKHRYAPIDVDVVGRAMVALAFDGDAQALRVVESEEIAAVRAPTTQSAAT
jgi:uncharacterized protein YbjT (DUF2867 family)